MRVTYVGPAPAQVVPVPGGADIEFPAGEPVEVPEALGRRLAAQPTFVADGHPAGVEHPTAAPVETPEATNPRAKPRTRKES